MKYTEFLSAARKHYHTSEILYSTLETHLKQTNPDNGITKRITLNLYYISGYVIECTLKYGIFALIGYDKKLDITKINSNGITYNTTIKNHRFHAYDDIFNREHPGLILVDRNSDVPTEVKALYNNWDAEVRYIYNPIPEKFKFSDQHTHVMRFNEYARAIFKHVESDIR
ncbi:hypothetical protein [Pectobacterium versatile]|uniref:hypothetical protein n=1 Tax=Pectobacterium versatile TaxID=2488639 RepID=UPI001BB2EB35|nr:hypothetical protein [Pectobacterium versatile]